MIATQPYIDHLCWFRALGLHRYGTEEDGKETSNCFKLLPDIPGGPVVSKSQGVHMNDLANMGDFLQLNV